MVMGVGVRRRREGGSKAGGVSIGVGGRRESLRKVGGW